MDSASTYKILLAEDDGDDQFIFHDSLKSRPDLELLPPVENGEALIDYLQQAAEPTALPDAIILDQNMPRRNGLQTLAILKNTNQYAHIPVMVYSTYADENLIERSKALGATLVMSKPVTAEGYHQLIDTFLNYIR